MDDLVTGQSLSADNFGLPFRMHADPSIHMLYVWQYRLCVCLCVWLHAASVRQTALFEVAGTGALTAWQAPAGYWPTDGAEGEVCWGDRGDCRVEGWELEEGGRGSWRKAGGHGHCWVGICQEWQLAPSKLFIQSARPELCPTQ